MTDDLKKSLRGSCGECDHVWTIAWLPMPLEKAAELMKGARCPKCACATVFVASEAES